MGVAGKDVIGNPDETLEILFGLNLTHLDFHMINHIPYPLPHFHISFPDKGLAFRRSWPFVIYGQALSGRTAPARQGRSHPRLTCHIGAIPEQTSPLTQSAQEVEEKQGIP
ncbi:hypothetical protein JCM17843_28720 [Kordiimonadales bacterium JCM 17843]|nr:hypothetical protein JCM17843_28720 [Kordiimonadales bacterium JCM 17843]